MRFGLCSLQAVRMLVCCDEVVGYSETVAETGSDSGGGGDGVLRVTVRVCGCVGGWWRRQSVPLHGYGAW